MMEKKVQTIVVYWDYIGILEKKWKLLQYVGIILG